MSVTLYLAIPCYNEEAVLPETARRLREKFTALRAAGTIGPLSRICFIDDGSKDATWQLISGLHARDPVFSGIRLSRNRGHQNALLCGLMTLRNRADCVISMDADLQDDIDAIDAMLAAFQNGNDIVYGVRASRKQDSAFKRATAQGYYRLLRALGADVVYNHADYRLMSAARSTHSRSIKKSICSCAGSCRSWATRARSCITSAASALRAKASTRCARCSRLRGRACRR